MIGATSNSNTNTGNFNVSRLGIRYYYFAIFDENLNRITEKSFGGGFDEQLNKIHKINENEFWLCGFSNSQISGTKQAAPKGFYDYWIVALDSMGEYKWDKTIGTSNADYLMDIISLTDNKYLLLGSSNGGSEIDKSEESFGDLDFWIICIDADGNKLWDRTYGGNATDYLYFGFRTEQNIFLGGTSNSEISGNKTAPKLGISDVWILKLDLNGNLISDKSFSIGNNAQTLITDFKAIDEDRILITLSGAAQNNSTINFSNGIFNQHIINGEIDYLLLELDYNLNITYKHTIGGAGSDVATGLFDFNNRMFVSGVSNSDIGFDKQISNYGGLDNWVVVLNDLLSLKQPYQQIDVSVFPNPSNGIINLQMNEWTN